MSTVNMLLSTAHPESFRTMEEALLVSKTNNECFTKYWKTKDFAYIHKFYNEDSVQVPSPQWFTFMNNPSLDTARAFVELHIKPIHSAHQLITTHDQQPSLITTGAGNTRSRLTKAQGQTIMRTFIALDSLHDLISIPNMTNVAKFALADVIHPAIDQENVALKRAFVYAPASFTNLASAYLAKTLSLSEAVHKIDYKTVREDLRPAYMYGGIETMAPLRSMFKKKNVKIVLDNIVYRGSFSFQNSLTAALLLVLLGNQQDCYGLCARSHNAPQTITLLDGDFMDIDSMLLLPFIEKYMFEMHKLTSRNVQYAIAEGRPKYFEKYCQPVTLERTAIRIGTSAFPIYPIRNSQLKEPLHPSASQWSLPYNKHDLRTKIAAIALSQTSEMQDILDVNFLRDAYRIDIACLHNALYITHDELSFRYFQWLKKNHSSIKSNGLLLNVRAWKPVANITMHVA